MADPFAHCLERLREAPQDYESSFCFYEAARPQRRWSEAIAHLERHLANDPDNGWVQLNLGNIHWWSEPDRAEASYRVAAETFVRQGNTAGEVLTRVNLHGFLSHRHQSEAAHREVERVIEAASHTRDPVVRARALILEAVHIRSQGDDLESAYRLFRQAEPLIFPNGPYRLRRSCLVGLGSICFRLGRYSEARTYYERLENLASRHGDDYGRALFLYNQANTLLNENFELPSPGGRDELISLFRKSLTKAQDVGTLSTEILSRRNLGDLLGPSAESRQEARQHLERCVELSRQSNHERRLSACLLALGGHLAHWGEFQEADQAIEESLILAQQADDPERIARALEKRMRLRWSSGPRSRAIADSLAALDAGERLWDQQAAANGRARLFAAWSDLYYWPAGRLLDPNPERGDLELAFQIAERLRARILLESLIASRIDASPRPARADASDLTEALTRLVDLQRSLRDPALNAVERRRILRELEKAEMDEAEARLLEDTPAPKPEFADLTDIEASLQENEALLSFQVALWKDIYSDFGGGSWLVVSTRQGTRVYRLPDRAVLRPAVRLFNGLFEHRDGSEVRLAARLYQDLLAEAIDALPPEVDRLLIVPDGDLYFLPFAALRATVDSPSLAERFHLAQSPSATLWRHWRSSHHPERPAAALVLADPQPFSDSPSGESTERAWALAEGTRLGSLPYARTEGQNIVRHIGSRSQLLVGEDATETTLKQRSLAPYGVLHFAAHAVIDTEKPQRSAVLLSADAQHEDGLLQPRDIVNLNLAGHVVVLSACQSASGEVLRGEGVLSLARAFFEAGASTVVGSLWPLRDDDAATLFDHFYGHLADGENVSRALSLAQRDRIREGAPAAAWAGLVVIGDGTMILSPPKRSIETPWLLGLCLATSALLLVVFWQARWFRSGPLMR